MFPKVAAFLSSAASARSTNEAMHLRRSRRPFAAFVLAVLGLAACSPSAGNDGGGGGVTGAGGVGGASAGGSSNPGDGGSFETGGSGFVFQEGGIHSSKGGTDGGCGGQLYKGEIVPLDIYIMFDQSASMSCLIGGTGSSSRWDAVKTALTSFVQSPGAAAINVGLGYFGTAA